MSQATKIIIAVIIVALMLGGGFYFWQQQQHGPFQSATNNPPASSTILNLNQPTTNSSTITIMVPKNYDSYKNKMTQFAQEGGENPLKTQKFIKKELNIPYTNDLIKASAQAAAEEIAPSGGPAKASVAYLKVEDGTAYVLLDIDLDGWAGVSVSLAIIHPLVEKTLLQFSEIKNVMFSYAPEKSAPVTGGETSATGTWQNTPAEIKGLSVKNGFTYLSLDILSPNPNFLPGENDFFINQSKKLREVKIDSHTKFYKCGAGPDNIDTTADVSSNIKDFLAYIQQKITNKDLRIIYYFDLADSVIKNIYEQCLP